MTTALNSDLIGRADSLARLQTPALVLDLDAFQRNVDRMAEHCRASGIALRPHAKTHKCVEIARRQLAAGAVGICCAKLGEAEVMGGAGIGGILVTSPVVLPAGVRRLMALNQAVRDLMVVVDDPANAVALATAARETGTELRVLVDLDPGLHRTGVAPGPIAKDLVRTVLTQQGLAFMGLQCYAGHLMHIEEFEERKRRSGDVMATLARFRDELRDAGIPCPILTGGGTGTWDIDAAAGVLTELQGGSYIFMDRQYNEVGYAGSVVPFETALYVQASVISANTPRIVTTDAGYKSFATDADAPLLRDGAPEGAAYFFFGDEQGGIRLSLPDQELRPGHVVRLVTPHCDPTVNLYDWLHVVRDGILVDIWRIDARGCVA